MNNIFINEFDNNLMCIKGEPGIVGPRGEKGEIGEPGPRGGMGLQGLSGLNGLKGEKGMEGAPGESIIGSTGPKGEIGNKGIEGKKGEKGNIGDPGTSLNIINENDINKINFTSNINFLSIFKTSTSITANKNLYYNNIDNSLIVENIPNNKLNLSSNIISFNSNYEDNILKISNPRILEKSSYKIDNRSTTLLNSNIYELSSKYLINKKLESIYSIPDINTDIINLPNKPIQGFMIKELNNEYAYINKSSDSCISNIYGGEIISDSYKLNSLNKSIGIAFKSINNNLSENINKDAGKFKYFGQSYMKSYNLDKKYIENRSSELHESIRGGKRLIGLCSLDSQLSKDYPFCSGINNTEEYINSFKNHINSIIKPGNVIRTALNFSTGFTNKTSGWRRESELVYRNLPEILTNKKYNKNYYIKNNINNNTWSKEKYKTNYFIPPGDPGCYFKNKFHPGYYENAYENNNSYGENQMPWGVITKLLDFIVIPKNYNSNNDELIGENGLVKISTTDNIIIDHQNYKDTDIVLAIIEIETLNYAREFEYWCPHIQKNAIFENSINLFGIPQYNIDNYCKKNNYDNFIYNYTNYIDIIDYRGLTGVINNDQSINWNILWNYLENPEYDWNEVSRGDTNLILDTLEILTHPTLIKTNLENNYGNKKLLIKSNLTNTNIYIDELNIIDVDTDLIVENNVNELNYITINDEFINISKEIYIKIISQKYIPNLLSCGKLIDNNNGKFRLDSFSNLVITKNLSDITLKTDIENINIDFCYNSTNNNYNLSINPEKININGKLSSNNISILLDTNIEPTIDSRYSLGNSTKYWKNIYVNDIYYNNLITNNNDQIIGLLPLDINYNNEILTYSNKFLENKSKTGTKINCQTLKSISITSEIIGSNSGIFDTIQTNFIKSKINIYPIKNLANTNKYLELVGQSSITPECLFRGKIKLSLQNDIFIDLDEDIGKHILTTYTFEKTFIPATILTIENKINFAENNINLQYNTTGEGTLTNTSLTKLWGKFCNLKNKTTYKNTNISYDKLGIYFKHNFSENEINSNIWINWFLIVERQDLNNMGGEKIISNLVFI